MPRARPSRARAASAAALLPLLLLWLLVLVPPPLLLARETAARAANGGDPRLGRKKVIQVRDDAELAAYQAYNRGVGLERAGERDQAALAYTEALAGKPDLPEATNNLAGIYKDTGRLADAGRLYAQLLEGARAARDVDMQAVAHNNLGLIEFLKCSTRGEGAASSKEQAIHDPKGVRTLAIPHYQTALRLDPNFANAAYNLGNAYQMLGEDDQALAHFLRVLAIDPDHVTANMNLGNLFVKRNRFDQAAIYHERAARGARYGNEDPEMQYNALNNLGQTLREHGDLYGALTNHLSASAIDPGGPAARVQAIVARRSLCLWRDWDREHQSLANAAAERAGTSVQTELPPYDAMLMRMPELQHHAALSLAALGRRVVAQFESRAADRLAMPSGTRERPVRLGYLSYDMREHPMGYLTHGLFVHHDRARFAVHVYMYGERDDSEQRARVERAADRFVDLLAVPTDEAAARIRSDGIDIVVDLMAHTRGARIDLAAHFPATTYVNYLGYPGTAGFDAPGAFAVVDRQVVPGETAARGEEMTETLIYMPHSYQANDFSPGAAFCATTLGHARLAACRAASSLSARVHEPPRPDGAPPVFRFANFNTLHKMEPLSFAVWCNVLRRVPRSVLLLLQPKDRGALGANITANLRAEAESRGIHASRLLFVPRESKAAHLDRLVGIDLFLDSFVYGAHSTATDALWAGVPVLTARGSSFPGRVGASLLAALDMPELVATSLRDFEDVAVAIGRHPFRALALRRKLGRQLLRAPLFDTLRATRTLEAGLLATQERRTGHPWAVVLLAGNSPAPPTRDWQAQLDAALALHQQGEVARAINMYQRLLAALDVAAAGDRDVAAQALHLLGLAEGDANLVERATRLVSRALYWSNLGHLRKEKGDFAAARAAFSRAVDVAEAEGNVVIAAQALQAFAHLRFGASAGTNDQDDKLLLSDAEALVARATALCAGAAQRAGPSPELLASQAAADAVIHRLRETHPAQAARALCAVARQLTPVGASRFERLYQCGALYGAAGRHADALRVFQETVLAENRANFDRGALQRIRASVPAAPSGAARIAIYCHEYGQTWWPNWGPRSPDSKGAGGSEEAVIFLSRELVRLGYRVEVYADPLEEDQGVTKASQGVVWLPHTAFAVDDPPDVFVAWRYHISVALGRGARSRLLWLQDVVSHLGPQIRGLQEQGQLDLVLGLSRFHLRTLPEAVQLRSRVLPNALQEGFFEDGANLAHEFIYASAPNRGLEQLLGVWPAVRAAVPGARLRVYYGFSPAFLKWGASSGVPDFDGWVARMRRALAELEPQGVEYVGMVGHRDLARAYARAGFMLYPTSFPETGCVSAMKAMAMGAVPITSRFENSSLPDLAGQWDLGPHPAPGAAPIARDPAFLAAFKDAVIAAAQRRDLDAHRAAMKAWARRELLWSGVARRFASIVTSTTRE